MIMCTLVMTHADRAFCDFFRRKLEVRGHRVIQAADGDACLSRCREELPDAVALSLAIAGRNDFAVMRELKEKHASIRRIVFADSGNEDDILDCKRFGCFFYIRRHVRVIDVALDIERVMDGQIALPFFSPEPTR